METFGTCFSKINTAANQLASNLSIFSAKGPFCYSYRIPDWYFLLTKLKLMKCAITTALVVMLLILSTPSIVFSQKKLSIIGSSTSACYGLSYFDCYVGRLDSFYNNHGTPTNVFQFAQVEYSCYRGMPSSFTPSYTDPNLQPDTSKNISRALNLPPPSGTARPDVVIINYPTNSYDSLPIDSIMFCLRTMKDSANVLGIPCYVTTTQPRTSGSFAASDVKLKLAILKDSILNAFGYFSLDFWNGLYDPADTSILAIYSQGDDTHFNPAGHAILFQRVVDKNIFNVSLPATFLNFEAFTKNKSNVIRWLTSRETDVDHFEIQYSKDAITFLPLQNIPAQNNPGNHQYEFTNTATSPGWNYYKIVIVDKDDKKQSSPVLKAFVAGDKISIRRFMVQSSQAIIEIQSSGIQQAELQIVSDNGMVVKKESVRINTGVVTIPVNIDRLAKGIYYIRLFVPQQEPVRISFFRN